MLKSPTKNRSGEESLKSPTNNNSGEEAPDSPAELRNRWICAQVHWHDGAKKSGVARAGWHSDFALVNRSRRQSQSKEKLGFPVSAPLMVCGVLRDSSYFKGLALD